ncbi:MAG: outer membrane protein assembly factor BamD [Ignavibacteriaceae bacterium]|nr:outer membrane protein assembly factor BamD [Ignavibacteriaceae bacterium]
MKNIFILILFSLVIWGCGSTVDTTNMPPENRLAYAIKLYNDEDYEQSVNEFSSIVLQYPGNSIVDTAQYYTGLSRYKRREYILGAYEFSKLIKNMPASKLIAESQYMLADCYYRLSPNFTLDQKYTRSAIKEFQSYIDFFPTGDKVSEAETKIKELNEKLAHKEYNSAYIYSKLEYYRAALQYYDNVVEIYHDSKYAPLAMYDKTQLLISMDKKSDALIEANKFLLRYPTDNHFKDMQDLKNSLEMSASR